MTTRTKAKTNELPEPPAQPSALLQSAIDHQERELEELKTRMDALSEEYATKARAIVLQGLEDGRTKAKAQILTIDIPSFFDSEGNSSPLPLPQNLALPPDLEAEAHRCLALET